MMQTKKISFIYVIGLFMQAMSTKESSRIEFYVAPALFQPYNDVNYTEQQNKRNSGILSSLF